MLSIIGPVSLAGPIELLRSTLKTLTKIAVPMVVAMPLLAGQMLLLRIDIVAGPNLVASLTNPRC